jgi:hypothetical protein
VGGGLFGTSQNFTDGVTFCNGSNRQWQSRIQSGSGNCFVRQWHSADERECLVDIHIGVSAFGGVSFLVQLFVGQ